MCSSEEDGIPENGNGITSESDGRSDEWDPANEALGVQFSEIFSKSPENIHLLYDLVEVSLATPVYSFISLKNGLLYSKKLKLTLTWFWFADIWLPGATPMCSPSRSSPRQLSRIASVRAVCRARGTTCRRASCRAFGRDSRSYPLWGEYENIAKFYFTVSTIHVQVVFIFYIRVLGNFITSEIDSRERANTKVGCFWKCIWTTLWHYWKRGLCWWRYLYTNITVLLYAVLWVRNGTVEWAFHLWACAFRNPRRRLPASIDQPPEA